MIRQIDVYDNGPILGYHSRMTRDELGGISEEPLDNAIVNCHFINTAEFNLGTTIERW